MAASWWGVFLLFLIPIGGGIPAGVVLAQKRGVGWPVMEVLYFLSDVVLAVTFEPILKFLIRSGRKVPRLSRISRVIRMMIDRTTANYGSAGGPLALVMIAFGVDPMTGRAAAHAAGHGFITGWMIAITGDMMFFTVIMVSTLYLNSILGDGTKTTIIILLLMFLIPPLVKRGKRAEGLAHE